jgi:AcrR family transcriptional regulator
VAIAEQRPKPWAEHRTPRSRRTTAKLLDAAATLFVENGVDGTTYDQIAELAGVARQTVFNHFPTKDDFVLAWGQRRRDEIAVALAETEADATSATQRLGLILRTLAHSYVEASDAGRVFSVAWVRLGGPVFEEPELADQFTAVIEDGQKAGEFRTTFAADVAGLLIRAAYFDSLWRWAAGRTDSSGLLEDLYAKVEVVLLGMTASTRADRIQRSLRGA